MRASLAAACFVLYAGAAQAALDAGAAGLGYGRHIYQADDPAAELDHYLKMVHGPAA